MIILLDSSAVLNNFGFEFEQKHSYKTSPLAAREFKDLRSRHLLENALNQGLLEIVDPKKDLLQKIEALAEKKKVMGLSDADKSILALALEFKKKLKKPFLVITDDHSIQLLLKGLKVPFESVIRGMPERAKFL